MKETMKQMKGKEGIRDSIYFILFFSPPLKRKQKILKQKKEKKNKNQI